MKSVRNLLLCVGLIAAGLMGGASTADAGYRQYYSSWTYYPSNSYYYTTYYYKPTPTYSSYNYHYCIHYPSQPRYVYYYNPHSHHYWGRLDLESKDPTKAYSILKPEDRKEKLADIPEAAFPAPAAMPKIPDATDDVQIEPVKDVPGKDLPPAAK